MKNSKVSGFFSKGRKWVFTLALFLLVFAAASIVKVQAASTVMGWLWGGSEDANIGTLGTINGNETGVGWISMSGANSGAGGGSYGVTIDDAGKVSGYGWANASDAPNSSASQEGNGLGWVDFDPQDHCVTGAQGAGQYKAASCTPPSGSAGVFRSGNNLTGWARFVGIAKESANNNSGGWQGWLQMYNVTIDPATGKFSGYAWNGEEPGTGGNTANGLGWVDFSRASIIPTTQQCIIKFTDPSAGSFTLSAPRSLEITVTNPTAAGMTVNFGKGGTNPEKFNLSNTSCPINGSNKCVINVSPIDQNSTYTATITASASNCQQNSVNGTISQTAACTLSCPDSVLIPPGGTDTFCTVSGSGCSMSSCTSSDSILESVGTSGNSCQAEVKSDADYTGTATVTAHASDGSTDTVKIYVKRLGWIETNP